MDKSAWVRWGRDRRVRRSVGKPSESHRKSRQPGARAKSSGEESEKVLFGEAGRAEEHKQLVEALLSECKRNKWQLRLQASGFLTPPQLKKKLAQERPKEASGQNSLEFTS